jgi:hypothetical protein
MITDNDSKLLWNIIHYNHIGKLSQKQAKSQYKKLIKQVRSRLKNKKTSLIDHQPIKTSHIFIRGGTKDKQVMQQKQDVEEKQDIEENQDVEEKTQQEIQEEMLSKIFKNVLLPEMAQQINESTNQIQNSFNNKLMKFQDRMDIGLHKTNIRLNRIEGTNAEILNMAATGSSFWDLKWSHIPTWLKSQFKKEVANTVYNIGTIPFKVAKSVVVDGIVGSVIWGVKKSGGTAIAIGRIWVIATVVATTHNFFVIEETRVLPENEINTKQGFMCLSKEFNLNKDICLQEQTYKNTDYQYYVEPYVPTEAVKVANKFSNSAYNVADYALNSGNEEIIKMGNLYVNNIDSVVQATLQEGKNIGNKILNEATNQITSGVLQGITSLGSGVKDTIKSTGSYLYSWFSSGGKKRIKSKKSKKIRKHQGINQETGRLKKGYKYSGKKLKSGLPQIIKIKK